MNMTDILDPLSQTSDGPFRKSCTRSLKMETSILQNILGV